MVRKLLKNKFFTYAIVAPTLGVMLVYCIMVYDSFSIPTSLNSFLYDYVFRVIIMLFFAPCVGLMALPVSVITYLMALLFEKNIKNKNYFILLIAIIGGMLSYCYALLVFSYTTLKPYQSLLDYSPVVSFGIIGVICGAFASKVSS